MPGLPPDYETHREALKVEGVGDLYREFGAYHCTNQATCDLAYWRVDVVRDDDGNAVLFDEGAAWCPRCGEEGDPAPVRVLFASRELR